MNSFSIIIPVLNEQHNIPLLYNEIIKNNVHNKINHIIFVDDFSNDLSVKNIKELINKDKKVKLIQNNKNFGQSYSISRGVNFCEDNTVITIDADLQNNTKDILKLIELYNKNEDIFLIGGLRLNRKDTFTKKITSRIANNIRQYILSDNCSDTGCALKVFDKDTFLKFPYFDGIHRFLPALFKGYGKKTLFIPVDHRLRIHGFSKYGTFKRLFKGILDLYKVYNLIKNSKKND